MTNKLKKHQRIMYSYNASGVKNFNPETDKTTKHFRSRVPLVKHIPTFKTTQLRYQNQFNEINDPLIIDKTGKPVIHSIFINYAWNQKLILIE